MSTTPTPPPAAGWYPAPDGSPNVQWWDGAQWTPHRRPTPPTQPYQQPQPGQPEQAWAPSSQPYQPTTSSQPWTQPGQPASGFPGRQDGSFAPGYPVVAAKPDGLSALATWAQVLIVICGLVSLATIVIELFGINVINRYLDGDTDVIDLLEGYDAMTAVVSIATTVFIVASGIVWAIWQYRAAARVAGRVRRTPGWHAGSWFIPFVSYFLPYQNISDLWRAAGRRPPGWQIAWWLLWVFGNLVVNVSTQLYLRAETLEEFLGAAQASLTGQIFMLAAAPFAWLVVRGLTRALEQGPSAPIQGFQPWQPR